MTKYNFLITAMYLFLTIGQLLVAPLSALVPQGFTVRQPKCIYLVDPGPCKEWVKVWGFDYLTNRCIFYYYGGCGGNPNRFYTKAECLETCRVYDDPNRKRRKDSDDSEDMFESDIDDWDHFEL
ncbi:kunitz-type serine protease inhibitor textilinin-5-like [Drosophila madeirensis]|uniref:Kunitz-type serine protease inhibitor textilinin-5-like n=1 Tax=Drosophila madeirensis TaxID=30013 RepID=A0AAU9FZ49_DROMD